MLSGHVLGGPESLLWACRARVGGGLRALAPSLCASTNMHNAASFSEMTHTFEKDGAIVSDRVVYDDVFSAFSVPLRLGSSKRKWGDFSEGTFLARMGQFVLRSEDHVGVVRRMKCRGASALGASGLIFHYLSNCGVGLCLKLTTNDWNAPAGLRLCTCIVPHSVGVAGRFQVMASASDDLWAYHARLDGARRFATSSSDERATLTHAEHVFMYKDVSMFLIESALELIKNDVANADVKCENVLVFADAPGRRQGRYKFCDIESFCELDGSSNHLVRCTFEPCSSATKLGALTTVFATICTAFDFSNNLIRPADRVDFSWCEKDMVRPAVFTLSHPFVVSASEKKNTYTTIWNDGLRALARHCVWGNQANDRIFVLSVLNSLHDKMLSEWGL